jgi:hypothetical protein
LRPLAALSTVALLALPADARADDLDEGIPFKSVALQVNPLGVVIGRYSADLEYLPATHHALHLTILGYFALPGASDELTGFGAEMGYRYYSGLYGPHGFFAGASFLAYSLQYVHAALPGVPLESSDDTAFVQLGGALDVGYQLVFLGNLAVGAGVGVQVTEETPRPHFDYAKQGVENFLYGPGVRPRALLSAGAAF